MTNELIGKNDEGVYEKRFRISELSDKFPQILRTSLGLIGFEMLIERLD